MENTALKDVKVTIGYPKNLCNFPEIKFFVQETTDRAICRKMDDGEIIIVDFREGEPKPYIYNEQGDVWYLPIDGSDPSHFKIAKELKIQPGLERVQKAIFQGHAPVWVSPTRKLPYRQKRN